MRGKRKGRRWLRMSFLGCLGACAVYAWHYVDASIPDQISIVQDEREEFSFRLPFNTTLSSQSREVVLGSESNIPAGEITISGGEPFSMYAKNKGSYQVGLKLFGLIEFKDIQVDVVDTRYAIPCGTPIGIYLKSDGIMVIGTGKLTGEDGAQVEPAYGVLRSGDYIEAFNGKEIETKEELMEEVNRAGGESAALSLRRDGERVEVSLTPVKTQEGDYKLGAWVRDDTQGIGTVTYVDLNGGFGALGHGISDSDTGELVQSQEGSLYSTQILGVEKGGMGKPGLLSGVIYYGPSYFMGTITANTDEGIFGTVNANFLEEGGFKEAVRAKGPGEEQIPKEALEVARRQEVKPGPALIRSSVSGKVEDYEIEIQKVDYNASHKNKSMVIQVTDPKLIELTGGIVQGMVMIYNRGNTGNPLFYKVFQVLTLFSLTS